uniref:RRM domain-containing protein n=1 Tax=Mesocestoides corti TaxID=53468 RepID=A0A5K3EN55_MESCO
MLLAELLKRSPPVPPTVENERSVNTRQSGRRDPISDRKMSGPQPGLPRFVPGSNSIETARPVNTRQSSRRKEMHYTTNQPPPLVLRSDSSSSSSETETSVDTPLAVRIDRLRNQFLQLQPARQHPFSPGFSTNETARSVNTRQSSRREQTRDRNINRPPQSPPQIPPPTTHHNSNSSSSSSAEEQSPSVDETKFIIRVFGFAEWITNADIKTFISSFGTVTDFSMHSTGDSRYALVAMNDSRRAFNVIAKSPHTFKNSLVLVKAQSQAMILEQIRFEQSQSPSTPNTPPVQRKDKSCQKSVDASQSTKNQATTTKVPTEKQKKSDEASLKERVKLRLHKLRGHHDK